MSTDMLPLLPEYTKDQFDSRHRLVLVAAQRAKQLMQGSKPIGALRFTKETTIALDEVLNHGVPFLRGQEARDAMKEARKGREMENERMAMMTAEDAREIKKELSNYIDDSPKAPPAAAEPAEAEE
ncbi:MAG: DNA-directed RNA polymerase subunit omega [Nitrospiraceae bacterium]